MVMAAVYNSEGHTAYSYPPSSNPFTAHYVDAMAAANAGETGYNHVQTGFTHTVFTEEATATWCPHCPSMAGYFYQVYVNHTYPFYFISLVGDMNSQAYSHLVSDYNLYGYPTGYFDGGYKVLLGHQYSVSPTTTNIVSSGARAVADLNFSVSCTIISSGTQLKDRVRIYSNYVSQFPETPAAPDGPTTGLVGYPYQFSAIATDPQNDPMYYWFDWGDGTNSGWVGAFSPGVHGVATHTWTHTGSYSVKVKAKDTGGHETGYSSTSPITITGINTEITMTAVKGAVNATIRNPGGIDYTNLAWHIVIKGGIFHLININNSGSIALLPIGGMTHIQSDSVFGLGKVTISVEAGDSIANKNGFVFGPILKLT